MKVLVCGSRDWDRPTDVKHRLREFPDGTTIIHGGAQGADFFAGLYARALGFNVQELRADWKGHGKRAGILRNLAMLDLEPDLVLAFHRNDSRGTAHTIGEARKRGIPVEVVEDPS